MENNLCPCSSGKYYNDCCKPLHDGESAKNALMLMRSRFAAYALNNPDYIVATTHPASPQYSENKFSWKRSISQFSKSSSFHKLEILDVKEQNTLATVTFTAYITQDNIDCTFSEKSFFEFFRGRWFYRGGQLAQGHAPNLVTTGQLRLLPLVYYGDPTLRKKAEPIKEISADIKKLVDEMIETMDACNGIGLAAPQIRHSLRLFIIRKPIESKENHYTPGEVKVFINPKIISQSSEKWKAQEGCLSIPTIHANVERAQEIMVEYTNLDGVTKIEKFSGWEAKVIQHENDHLDGILFIDHLEDDERSKLEPFLNNLKRRIHDGIEM